MPKCNRFRKCVVDSCNADSSVEPFIKFIKFPDYGTDKFYIWIKSMDKIDLGKGLHYICAKHFTPGCFGEKKLSRYAVPTIFPSTAACTSNNSFPVPNFPSCSPSDTNKYFENGFEIQNSIDMNVVEDNQAQIGTSFQTHTDSGYLNVMKSENFKSYIGAKEAEKIIEQCLDEVNEYDLLKTPPHSKNKMIKICESIEVIDVNKETQLNLLWRKKYLFLLKKYRVMAKNFMNMKKKNKYKKKESKFEPFRDIISNLKSTPNIVKTFCIMVLKNSLHRKSYTEDEKLVAQTLFFKSASLYNYLRREGFSLPSPSSIKRWMPIKTIQPGIINSTINELKGKFANNDIPDKDRIGILAFDEMRIRTELELNTKLDLIDGVCTDGTVRKNLVGKEICLFTIRSVFSDWKYILGYIVSFSSTKGENLKAFVEKILNCCFQNGVIIKIIVCDQGSSNRLFNKICGVTKDSPFLFYDKNDTRILRNHNEVMETPDNYMKIYSLYCSPHLLKSVRNILLKNDLEFGECDSEYKASWRYIKKLYDLDSQNSTRLCPKLTAAHIFPNSFAKMRVSFASQVLSDTVAAGIRTLIELEKIENESESTAIFIENINKLFDFLNIKNNKFVRGAVGAISEHKLEEQKYFIENMKTFLESIKIILKPGERTKTVYAFNGLIQNLNAVLEFANETLHKSSFEFAEILTGLLNQDIVENLFAIMRGSGGFNRYPSVREINNHLRFMLNLKYLTPHLKSQSSNCETDSDLLNISSLNNSAQQTEKNHYWETIDALENEIVNAEYNIELESEMDDVELDFDCENNSIEDNSINYFAGYVVKYIFQKYKCDECVSSMSKAKSIDNTREVFIMNKTYDSITGPGLKFPSDIYFEISRKQILYFKNTFLKLFCIPNIIKTYMIEMIEIANIDNPIWYDEQNKCNEHRLDALKFLLKVLIRKNCQWIINKEKKFLDNTQKYV